MHLFDRSLQRQLLRMLTVNEEHALEALDGGLHPQQQFALVRMPTQLIQFDDFRAQGLIAHASVRPPQLGVSAEERAELRKLAQLAGLLDERADAKRLGDRVETAA